MAEKVLVPELSTATEDISTGWALTLLEDPERRRLLVVLDDLDTPERLSALTRALAACTEQSDDSNVGRIRLRLYHTHVPKLVDVGVVTYDEDADTVALTERGAELAASLETSLD